MISGQGTGRWASLFRHFAARAAGMLHRRWDAWRGCGDGHWGKIVETSSPGGRGPGFKGIGSPGSQV